MKKRLVILVGRVETLSGPCRDSESSPAMLPGQNLRVLL